VLRKRGGAGVVGEPGARLEERCWTEGRRKEEGIEGRKKKERKKRKKRKENREKEK
jgi:hypothetical protein